MPFHPPGYTISQSRFISSTRQSTHGWQRLCLLCPVETPVGNRISHEHFLFACSWWPASKDNLRSLPPSQNPRHLAIRPLGRGDPFGQVGQVSSVLWTLVRREPHLAGVFFHLHVTTWVVSGCWSIDTVFASHPSSSSSLIVWVPGSHWFILVLKNKCPGQRIQSPERLSRGLWESEAAPGACLWSGCLLSLLLETILFDSCLLPVWVILALTSQTTWEEVLEKPMASS